MDTNIGETFDPITARELVHSAIAVYNKYVKGMNEVGTLMISSAIQGGICHFLGEGEPGGGKTRSAEVIAAIIGGKTFIVQGTPDLQPKDIMGSEWLDRDDTGKPIWKISWSPMAEANVVVGDEGNRLDTRTQSIFMSPMSEGRCTIMAPHVDPRDTVRMMHPVRVFLWVQNDVGSEGTNILPPAQYDRFLYKIDFTRIDREAEKALLMDDTLGDREVIERAATESELSLDLVLEIRKWIRANMFVHERFVDYQLSVIRATVPGTPEFKALWKKNPEIRPILESIKSGVSVRGSMAFRRACQVRAFLFGKDKDGETPRNFVMPEDLHALAHRVMDHRIVMVDRAATRRVQGKEVEGFFDEYPTDGTITRKQVVERLNRPGKNPILPSHVTDAVLTHLDFTADPSAYSR
jgi:MoxR-like ATPase